MKKDAFIGQLLDRYSFASSTDIVGLLTSSLTFSPFDAYLFMCEVLGCQGKSHQDHAEYPHGLELGLLKHLLLDPIFLNQLQTHSNLIAGVHVQTGGGDQDRGFDRAKLMVSNETVEGLVDGVRFAGSLPTHNALYVNTHRPVLAGLTDDELRKLSAILKAHPNIIIAAEHHKERHAHQKLQTQLKRANQHDLPVIPTTDLYHVMASDPSFKFLYQNEFALLWKNTMYVLEQTGQCIVHIPIGTDLRDSIPIVDIDTLTDEMLVQLAGIMADLGCFPTIEYQRGLRRMFLANPSNDRKEIARARQAMRKLVVAGIIKLHRRNFYSLPPRREESKVATAPLSETSHVPL